MRYVETGGLRLSVIGLGTWQFGSREWGYGPTYASDTAPAIVRRAIELGVTLIDTAEVYGFGRSERIVGEAIRGRREGLIIASKLVPALPIPSVVGWQVRGSLRRLGIDALDLYQVHFPNPFVSSRSTMAPMRTLLEEGLVRHIGVSNYSLERWRAAERGLGRPVLTNQVRFSLAAPLPHWELVPYARDEGRVIIAYSPLGQGLLSGSHALNGPAPADVRGRNLLFRPRSLQSAEPLLAALRDTAAAHAATPAQVALAWLIGHGNVVAIPGARTVTQLEDNVAAGELELSGAEMERLTAAAVRFESAVGR
ncbi:MAG: aldo/keto reductase [Candidatus Limnocylindrales bacterium]|jgi:aryl-alcohol dehydrogenase-like predicted oxidoreductase